MKHVAIITEANERVATGHLMECITCAEELLDAGCKVSFWINSDMKKSLKDRIPCEYSEYGKSVEENPSVITNAIKAINPQVVVFNLREISEEFLSDFKLSVQKVIICIDEYGHRKLDADIIINPMIDPFYWKYIDCNATLYCGAEYLVLGKQLEDLHKKKKEIKPNIQKILITMGGVDPRNHTKYLADAVPEIFPNADIEIVLGGGYRHREEIVKKIGKRDKVVIKENVPDLPEKIYEADLVFCAGGNTLHETACIGTPAIVLPSMPHEVRTAECFAKKGFGYVVNREMEHELKKACEFIKNFEVRASMSNCGKKTSDGMGRKRIAKIVSDV